jgi:PIN domain nuclease of toxin-antitoxin system
MKLLLDTHYLIWISNQPEQLSDKEKALLTSEKSQLYYSPLSFWEMSIKFNLGKLKLAKANPEIVQQYIEKQDIAVLPFGAKSASSFFQLPKKEDHKDPFDRMLIWQAIQSEMILLSRDRKFAQYVEDGLMLRQEKSALHQ